MHDDRSSDNVIHGPVVKHVLDVEVKVLLVGADGPHQLCDVVGVQSAGLRGQTAGQIRVADVRHALQTEKNVLGRNPGRRADVKTAVSVPTLCTDSSPGTVVSMFPPASAAKSTTTEPSFMLSTICLVMRMGARLPAQDNANVTHLSFGRPRGQERDSGNTGDKSCADDDVHFLALLGKQLHLCLDELLRHHLGVASLTFSRLFNVHFQWLRPQRLKLFQSCGPGGSREKMGT